MRTPHSSCWPGKRVRIKLKDGRTFITRFRDKKGPKALIYHIFAQKIVPVRLFPLVSAHYAHMRQDNHVPITGWWLHDTFTAHIKTLAPAPAFHSTARLGKFFASKF